MSFPITFYQAAHRLNQSHDFKTFISNLEIQLKAMQDDLVAVDPQNAGAVGRLQGRISYVKELLTSITKAPDIADRSRG